MSVSKIDGRVGWKRCRAFEGGKIKETGEGEDEHTVEVWGTMFVDILFVFETMKYYGIGSIYRDGGEWVGVGWVGVG